MIYKNSIQSLIEPKVIQLSSNLFTLSFHVMKILPAYYIINKALQESKIDSATEIIETSSGSFAYGVALACHALGLKCHIVTDKFMEPPLQRQIEMLGSNVYKAKRRANLSSQTVRLNLLDKIKEKLDKSFWTLQYDNYDNSASYKVIARQIMESFGLNSPITLVGPVGSGGSTCGTITELRDFIFDARLVGVDCFNSVLFGQPDGMRRLGGFGNGLLPKNLKHEYFDEVHWLSDEYSIYGMRTLFEKKSLFCGHTTGAAYLVARHIAEKNPQQTVIFISPDSGHRYVNTYYNDSWLKENFLCLPTHIEEPLLTSSPSLALEPWAYMNWDRSLLSNFS